MVPLTLEYVADWYARHVGSIPFAVTSADDWVSTKKKFPFSHWGLLPGLKDVPCIEYLEMGFDGTLEEQVVDDFEFSRFIPTGALTRREVLGPFKFGDWEVDPGWLLRYEPRRVTRSTKNDFYGPYEKLDISITGESDVHYSLTGHVMPLHGTPYAKEFGIQVCTEPMNALSETGTGNTIMWVRKE